MVKDNIPGQCTFCLTHYFFNSFQYGHALVIGMERYPRPVTKNMSKTKLKRRSKIKPFIKVANYNHMMPTRYSVDINFTKSTFNKDALKEPPKRKIAR